MADPVAVPLLTDEEAKRAVKKPTIGGEEWAMLQAMVAAVRPVLEAEVGPIELRSEVLTVDGGRVAIVLPWRPFSVTSVVELGVTLDSSAYTVNEAAGIIYRGGPGSPGWWSLGAGAVQVTALIGSDVIGPNIKFAAMELVRHWWQVGRQGPGIDGGAGEFVVPQGFLLPNRVKQLCTPDRAKLMPGFA